MEYSAIKLTAMCRIWILKNVKVLIKEIRDVNKESDTMFMGSKVQSTDDSTLQTDLWLLQFMLNARLGLSQTYSSSS